MQSCQPPSAAEMHSLIYSVALWRTLLTYLSGLVTALVGIRVKSERIENIGWGMVAAFMVEWTLFQIVYKIGPLGSLFC
jgi:hypothetical protein